MKQRGVALFVGLTLILGAIGSLAWALVDVRADDLDAVRRADRRAVTSALAARVETWFGQAKDQASAVALALTPFDQSARRSNRERIDQSLEFAPLLDAGAFVVDRVGNVVESSTSLAALAQTGQRRAGTHIEEALAGNPSASPIYRDPLLRFDVVAMTAPVTGRTGEVAGVLVALSRMAREELPGKGLVSHVEAIPVPAGLRLHVSDSSRQVIDPAADSLVGRTDLETESPVELAAKDASGLTEHPGRGGVTTVSSWKRTADGWTVVLSQDSHAFYSESRAVRRAFVLVIAALLSVPLATLTLAFRRIRLQNERAELVQRSFLAIVGHELRTPLTVIKGFTQTVLGRWDTIGDGRKKEIITTVQRQSRNLEHLVERLIVGAQLQAGVEAFPMTQDVDIKPLIMRVAEHHAALTQLHDIDVSLPDELRATVDSKLFEQVMTHLIENAIKYSPAGGVIRIAGARRGRRTEISVEDEGVGLPSDISGIFDKFRQGEEVDSRVYDEGGVGLGLFIAKTHLERMKGTVRAERRTPKGARFVVSVPN